VSVQSHRIGSSTCRRHASQHMRNTALTHTDHPTRTCDTSASWMRSACSLFGSSMARYIRVSWGLRFTPARTAAPLEAVGTSVVSWTPTNIERHTHPRDAPGQTSQATAGQPPPLTCAHFGPKPRSSTLPPFQRTHTQQETHNHPRDVAGCRHGNTSQAQPNGVCATQVWFSPPQNPCKGTQAPRGVHTPQSACGQRCPVSNTTDTSQHANPTDARAAARHNSRLRTESS